MVAKHACNQPTIIGNHIVMYQYTTQIYAFYNFQPHRARSSEKITSIFIIAGKSPEMPFPNSVPIKIRAADAMWGVLVVVGWPSSGSFKLARVGVPEAPTWKVATSHVTSMGIFAVVF